MDWYIAVFFFVAVTLFMVGMFIHTARYRRTIFRENLKRLGAPPANTGSFLSMKREWPHGGHTVAYYSSPVEKEDDPNDTSITILHQRPLNIGFVLSNLASVHMQSVSRLLWRFMAPLVKASTATYGYDAVTVPRSFENKFVRVWALNVPAASKIMADEKAVNAIMELLNILEPFEAELRIDDNGITMKLPSDAEVGPVFLDKGCEASHAIAASTQIPSAPPPAPVADKIMRLVIIALLITLIAAVALVIAEGPR